MQPQDHLQTLVRMLSFGQNPQAATATRRAGRWATGAGDGPVADHDGPGLVQAQAKRGRDRASPTRAWTTARAVHRPPVDVMEDAAVASDSPRRQAVGF